METSLGMHEQSVGAEPFLVTGCAGFIGSHLAETLLASGRAVVGVDCFTDYYPRQRKESNLRRALEHPNFEFLQLDLADAPLDELVGRVAGIYHLAAQPGVRSSWGSSFDVYLRRNLLATQRLFEAAVTGRRRVVFASSSSVYGDAERYPTTEQTEPRPISPYGVTKLSCEHLARSYAECFELDVVALRYFTVYGPRQRPDMAFARIIAALRDGSSFTVYGNGEQTRDFIYVADAVGATIAAMEADSPASVYNVGGGNEAQLLEVIDTLERLSGRQLNTCHEAELAGDVLRTGADTSLIRGDLGWAPVVPLEEGIAAQLAGG